MATETALIIYTMIIFDVRCSNGGATNALAIHVMGDSNSEQNARFSVCHI